MYDDKESRMGLIIGQSRTPTAPQRGQTVASRMRLAPLCIAAGVAS